MNLLKTLLAAALLGGCTPMWPAMSPVDATTLFMPPEERPQVTGEDDPYIPTRLCSRARLGYLMPRYPERFATEWQECQAYLENGRR